MPSVTGMETFKGDVHHSSAHPGPDGYKGKKAVVIGSNNSGHDICAALWEEGADVTMVQRSSTHVSRSDTLMDLALGDLYSEAALEAGVTTDKADLIFASLPYKVLPSVQAPVYEAMQKRDAEFYARLEKAGFMLDFGEDGSGLFVKYLRRGSGYYIDVGASDLVADGKIKLKSGVGVERIKEHSIVFTDGSELPADLIIFATGYGSMNGWAAQLISKEVADKVGKCWGLGSDTRKDPGPWEGELRNMWKPTHQEALWFHGGNLHQSRHYSRFLVAAAQGAHGRHPDAGLRHGSGTSPVVTLTPQLGAARTSAFSCSSCADAHSDHGLLLLPAIDRWRPEPECRTVECWGGVLAAQGRAVELAIATEG